MIIYYAMTKFHLIFSITHKRKTYGDEDAVLFLYSGLQGLEEEYEKILHAGFFKEIYIVPEIELKKGWMPLNDRSLKSDIEKNVISLVNAVEDWLPIPVSRDDTIYLANDHWAIGTYCIHKKIPYHYYEDGVGMLSKPEYSYELVRKMNVTHSIVAKYIGAFGLNDNVVEKLADLNNQSEGFYDEKAVHFSLKDELKTLSDDDMKYLLNIFDAPDLYGRKELTILLTEHFVNMKRLSIEGQKELYAMLVDFFGGKYLCIKPHPNDFQINYQQIFPEAEMISRFFPSELLPYCFSEKLELALAACSTSVFGLADIADRILRFDIDIENHYSYLIRYYVGACVLKKLCVRHVRKNGIYHDLLEAFYKDDSETEKNCNVKTWIIDDCNREEQVFDLLKSDEIETMIYLNSNNLFRVFSEKNFEINQNQWCVIRIKKECGKRCLLQNEKTEYIWVYSQKPEILNQVRHIKEKKQMKHVDVMLDVDCITDNQELKIKILEGNLRASLDRIDKYKEKELQYKNEIQKLKKKLSETDEEVMEMLAKVLEQRHKEEK